VGRVLKLTQRFCSARIGAHKCDITSPVVEVARGAFLHHGSLASESKQALLKDHEALPGAHAHGDAGHHLVLKPLPAGHLAPNLRRVLEGKDSMTSGSPRSKGSSSPRSGGSSSPRSGGSSSPRSGGSSSPRSEGSSSPRSEGSSSPRSEGSSNSSPRSVMSSGKGGKTKRKRKSVSFLDRVKRNLLQGRSKAPKKPLSDSESSSGSPRSEAKAPVVETPKAGRDKEQRGGTPISNWPHRGTGKIPALTVPI